MYPGYSLSESDRTQACVYALMPARAVRTRVCIPDTLGATERMQRQAWIYLLY